MNPVVKTNRWLVFMAAWLVVASESATNAISVFAKPLMEMHQWNLGEVNFAYTLFQVFFSIFGLIAGKHADAVGPRASAYAGGLFIGTGWFFSSLCTELWQYYIAFGVLLGSGSGCIFIAILTSVMRWFPDKRGTVSGCLLVAGTISPMVLSPVANLLIETFGVLTAYKIFGVGLFVIIAVVAWLLKQAPENYQPEGWVSTEKNTINLAAREYTWKQMLFSPMFCVVFVIFICAVSAGTMMTTSLSVIAQEQAKFTAMGAAFVVSLYVGANFVGRLSFGALCDKFGAFQALCISLSITVCGLACLGLAHSQPLFYVGAVLMGFAFAGAVVLFPQITGKCFGMKNLGINYGIMVFGFAAGAYVGPALAGHYRDTASSYTPAFVAAAVIALLGIGITLLVILHERKMRKMKLADAC